MRRGHERSGRNCVRQCRAVVARRYAMVKTSTMSALDENKALVRRHLEEAVNLDRPEVWSDIMAEDFIIHHPLVEPGRAGYTAGLGLLRVGFPDLNVEVLDVVAENDRVVVRYIERGTHTGEFMGFAPTGRRYEKHGFAMYRVANGLLAECWLQEDDQGFQQQTVQLEKHSSSGQSGGSSILRGAAGTELHIPSRR